MGFQGLEHSGSSEPLQGVVLLLTFGLFFLGQGISHKYNLRLLRGFAPRNDTASPLEEKVARAEGLAV